MPPLLDGITAITECLSTTYSPMLIGFRCSSEYNSRFTQGKENIYISQVVTFKNEVILWNINAGSRAFRKKSGHMRTSGLKERLDFWFRYWSLWFFWVTWTVVTMNLRWVLSESGVTYWKSGVQFKMTGFCLSLFSLPVMLKVNFLRSKSEAVRPLRHADRV